MTRLLVLTLTLTLWLGAEAHATTVHDESIDGDLSGVLSAPDTVLVSNGANVLIGQMGANGGTGATDGSDADYFSITIGAGQSLTGFTIDSYVFSPDNPGVSFLAYIVGTGFSGQGAGDIDGFTFFNATTGDLLPFLVGGPLGPGTYSFWLQETSANVVDYQFTATVVPEPSAAVLIVLGLIGLAASGRPR